MKRLKFWNLKKSSDDTGELYLYGVISSTSWYGDEITPKQFKDDLEALGDIKKLNIYINSDGGDVFAAQAIYSILSRHPAYKTTYVDGIAASAASLIVMAGDYIIMPVNSMLMIHNPWTIIMGNANELRKMADTLDTIRESMINVYEAKTGLSREKIAAMLDEETWLTAQKAVDLHFADEVAEDLQVAAYLTKDGLYVNGIKMDLSRYRHPPAIEAEKTPENPLKIYKKRLKLLEIE